MKKTILILPSDPNSVNYEIIKKTLFFFNNKKNKNNYVFVGDKKDLTDYTNSKNNNLKFVDIKKNRNTKLYLQSCFKKSFELLKNKKAHGIINMPLNKKFLPKRYPGFTEYISNFFNTNGKETMLLFSDNFSVCPNTTHIPLNLVSKQLSKNKIKKNILNIFNFYKNVVGLKKPIIGIMGLNPHNGVDFKGRLEEDTIIRPVIREMRKNNVQIQGPLSPDSAFNEIQSKKINCLIGNYHDQVLPTFKYINKFKAINITLGLPFLRISPDHGPAQEIQGKNIANPDSFLYALKFFEKYYKKI
jgi:4-hydroxy-L-threonine phosphate dehydrogenase PdxA